MITNKSKSMEKYLIEWFQAVPNKFQHAFITFNVCYFYPSILEQLLTKALDYASQFAHIMPQDRQIITNAKRPLLYHQNTPWEKKNTSNLFDFIMGSYDGAETCELVGVYMLSLIMLKIKEQVGLSCAMVWWYVMQQLRKLKRRRKKTLAQLCLCEFLRFLLQMPFQLRL